MVCGYWAFDEYPENARTESPRKTIQFIATREIRLLFPHSLRNRHRHNICKFIDLFSVTYLCYTPSLKRIGDIILPVNGRG